MVQCLKSTQTSNPLVLIDEVDKLGRGGLSAHPLSSSYSSAICSRTRICLWAGMIVMP